MDFKYGELTQRASSDGSNEDKDTELDLEEGLQEEEINKKSIDYQEQ